MDYDENPEFGQEVAAELRYQHKMEREARAAEIAAMGEDYEPPEPNC